MKTNGPGQMAAPISALLDRISEWRRNRKKRTAMPEELWQEATRLGREYGAYPVARDLNLHYERLKRRIQGLPAGLPKAHLMSKGFMELRAVTISEGQSGPAGEGCEFVTELELTRPGGGTLCVRQTGPEGVDIVGLAGAYFGKR
jgi:hypothetical protein